VDFSLYKNINITKRVKAQLRFEVFNIFNHVNFMQNNLNNGFIDHREYTPAARPPRRRSGYTIPVSFGKPSDPPEAGAGRHQLTF
jgi:hypothetical protein